MSFPRSWGSHAYWWAQRAMRFVLGSNLEERYFRRRGLNEVRIGFSNLTLPHRDWLASNLLDKASGGRNHTIVEVGSGWGPNLAVLAARRPDLALIGIDISPASVGAGRDKMQDLGLPNVRLLEGEASDLSMIESRSADLVFTDASLLYVGPDKIEKSLAEMMRVSRRYVVLLEMHDAGAGTGGRFTRDGWIRDYVRLGTLLFPSAVTRVRPLPAHLRPSGRWPRYGALIEIESTSRATSV